jgi:hypothetical protein
MTQFTTQGKILFFKSMWCFPKCYSQSQYINHQPVAVADLG